MELNQIYLGDAYELIKQVPDKSVDLIVTDPPYQIDGVNGGTGIFKWRKMSYTKQLMEDESRIVKGIDLSILDEFVRVMKKINVYLWCNKEQIYDYITYFVKERKCNWEMLVWAKENPTPFLNGHYLKDKEYCIYFWEKGVKVKPSFETGKTVFVSNKNMADKKEFNHPTIKPEPIIENLIINSCPEGGTVFDPFVGSGTTCAVAKRLGFRYLGFEISEKYHKIACDRMQGITQKEAKSGIVQMKLF